MNAEQELLCSGLEGYMWLRVAAIVWAVLCIVVAVNSAMMMFVTFAPRDTSELARAELIGIEQARKFWWDSVNASSGLLILSAVVIVVLAWKRR